MIDWNEFLRRSKADMRRNDLSHGVTFGMPGDNSGPRAVVQAYLDAYGWSGVGEREIVERTGLARSTVRDALAAIAEDGYVTITYTLTRGKKATKRKVYHSLDRRPLAGSVDPQGSGHVFDSTAKDGGRKIPVRFVRD